MAFFYCWLKYASVSEHNNNEYDTSRLTKILHDTR